jgi:hypothetical protein
MDSYSVDSNAGTPLMMESSAADPRTMQRRKTGFRGFLDAIGNPQPGQGPGLAGAIGQASGVSTMGGLGGRVARFFL